MSLNEDRAVTREKSERAIERALLEAGNLAKKNKRDLRNVRTVTTATGGGLTYLNSWVSVSGDVFAARLSNGWVQLQGRLDPENAATGTTIVVLPNDMRPALTHYSSCLFFDNSATGAAKYQDQALLTVTTGGIVRVGFAETPAASDQIIIDTWFFADKKKDIS